MNVAQILLLTLAAPATYLLLFLLLRLEDGLPDGRGTPVRSRGEPAQGQPPRPARAGAGTDPLPGYRAAGNPWPRYRAGHRRHRRDLARRCAAGRVPARAHRSQTASVRARQGRA